MEFKYDSNHCKRYLRAEHLLFTSQWVTNELIIASWLNNQSNISTTTRTRFMNSFFELTRLTLIKDNMWKLTPFQYNISWRNDIWYVTVAIKLKLCYWTANDHSLKVKEKIQFDKILGPSVFKLLSVRVSDICVCLSVCPQAARHSFDHTNLSIHI